MNIDSIMRQSHSDNQQPINNVIYLSTPALRTQQIINLKTLNKSNEIIEEEDEEGEYEL